LIVYVIVSVFTPNFYTLDSSAPKFLAIALVNLFAMLIFFFDKEYKKRDDLKWGFFKGFTGIAYLLFIFFSLLSFFNAINLSESLMNMVKIFTVFTSSYVLYVIFSSNKNYLKYIAISLVILLLIDSLTVFYGVVQFISGKLPTIAEIKSIYSNKNIFSSALFVKLPVAIWLLYYSHGWEKKLAYFSVFAAILATIFLSTRAFYLGLLLLLIVLIIYALIRYFMSRKKEILIMLARFAVIFTAAVLSYLFIQHYLFPAKKDILSSGIASRVSTITTNEASVNARLTLWKQSAQLIKEAPVLGIGSGNWKLVILKFENKTSTNFVLSYKNHNDFIEITAETGGLGGLAYLSIFFFIFLGIISIFKKKKT